MNGVALVFFSLTLKKFSINVGWDEYEFWRVVSSWYQILQEYALDKASYLTSMAEVCQTSKNKLFVKIIVD